MKKIIGSILAFAAVFAGNASAALSTGQQAAFDGIVLTLTDFETAAWLIVLPLTIAFVGIKLFKKFVNKAS